MPEVFFVITIDVECDKGPDWSVRHPLRFESVREGLGARLMPLCRTLNLRPTLLLSPEVVAHDPSAEFLAALEGCELGAHCHVEFLEPCSEPAPGRTNGTQCALAPELEWQKLRNLTNLFERKIGRRPRSFRAGRFALSRRTLKFLVELGYGVDSSVTPFRTWRFGDGLEVNY